MRRRTIVETAVVLLLCSTSITGFTVGGRSFVPLTRKHSTRSSNPHIEPSVDANDTQSNRKFPWTKKPHNAVEDDKELREDQAVDEYLEFLDRRYRRLHDDEPKSSEQMKPGFSAWSWLHQSETSAETVTPQQTQADALYVLGVAGLASKKLLQKHQIHFEKINHRAPKQQEATPTTNIIDVVSDQSPVTASLWLQKKQLLMSKLAKVVDQFASKRRSLLLFQKRQLTTIARNTLIGCTQAPKELALKVWNLGGGKRNVMFAASLLVAFTFVIIQPLLKTAAREGLNMTIG